MSFGKNARTAVDDANANRVDRPSLRENVRGQGITGDKVLAPNTDTEMALAGLAKTLGSKISDYAAKKNEAIRAQKQLSGAMDQGRDKGISDITALEKRTGLGEFFLGQNAHYEGAQRRAVENNIVEWSTAELNSVEQHAGLSPEDYEARILKKYEEHAENFKGDPESLAMLQGAYSKASTQLMTAYTKERYAHTIAQNEETHRTKIAQNTDNLNVLSGKYSETDEEKLTIAEGWAEQYDYTAQMAKLPEGQRFLEDKFNSMHVENIVEQLNSDNVNAYDAGVELGFLGKQPRSVQEAVRGAHQRYQHRRNNAAFIEKDEINQVAENYKTTEDELIARFNEGAKQHPQIIKSEQLTGLLGTLRRAKIAQEVRITAALKAGTKTAKSTPQDALLALQEQMSGDSTRREGEVEGSLDNKGKVMADNMSLVARMSNAPFSEANAEIDQLGVTKLLQTNPAYAENAARNLLSGDFITAPEKALISNLATDLMSAYTPGFANDLMDENGQLTAMGYQRIDNAYKYEKYHPGVFAKVLGKEDYLKMELFKYQVQQKVPMPDIVDTMKRWGKGGEADFFQNPMKNKDGTRKVQSLSLDAGLRNEFEKLQGKPYASPLALNEYKENYAIAKNITGNTRDAIRLANNIWAAQNETVMGKAMLGGRALQESMNSYANATPTLTVDPSDTHLYAMLQADPNKGGKGDYTIETNIAKVDDVMKWATDKGLFNSLYHDLGVQPDKDSQRFDRKSISNHKIDMQVHEGDDRVIFSSVTNKGVIQQYVDFRVFQQMQQQYSLFVYEKQRRAEMDAEHKTRVDIKLGEKSRAGGKTMNIPKSL